MGCYGIGTTRTVAAAIEAHHDEAGIIWPMSIAPYHVLITAVSMTEAEVTRVADELYKALLEAGVEVLYDDRDESPGIKFKDADLIGIPIRVTVGPRGLKKGIVEIRRRRDGHTVSVPVAEAMENTKEMIDSCDSES